ncbi:MAG: metal ABC transporter solute-binding protein, Zn/Mn family [Alkalispirochaetaceae bacterium]
MKRKRTTRSGAPCRARTAAVVASILLLLTVGPAVEAQQRVLATTPWTAAFARVAGAEEVELLAPYEMRHPPEYELRGTDLRRVEQADLVVYAGYEMMMERLRRALGEANVSSVQITTVHTMETIEESVMKIAAGLGTEEAARRNLAELRDFFDAWRREIREYGLHEAPVVVHGFQAELMGDLGVNIVGSFGPGPLEAQQIVRLSRSGAGVVIDNWHNEVAQPLKETLPGVPVASFLNFPGHGGTRTMVDVLQYNRRALREAMAE